MLEHYTIQRWTYWLLSCWGMVEEKYLKSWLPIINHFCFHTRGSFLDSVKLHMTYQSCKSEPRCFRLHWLVLCVIKCWCVQNQGCHETTQGNTKYTKAAAMQDFLTHLVFNLRLITSCSEISVWDLNSQFSSRHWPLNSKKLLKVLPCRGSSQWSGSPVPPVPFASPP